MPKLFERFDIKTPISDPNHASTFDPEPGVREPEPGTDFLPPNPDLPAVAYKDRDILDLLAEISRHTSRIENFEGIIYEHLFRRLPASAGEFSVIGSERVRNIYIPNVPRTMTFYTGSSRGMFLGKLVAGQSLKAELPYLTNGVYVEFEEGGDNEQVNLYLTSKPIDISIFGGPASGAVWG